MDDDENDMPNGAILIMAIGVIMTLAMGAGYVLKVLGIIP